MSLIRNGTYYGLATATNGFAGLIILPLYSRYLTTQEYGIVSAMEVLAGILAIFTVFSIDRAAQRFYYENDYGKPTIISTFFWGSVVSSSVLCLILYLGRDLLSYIFPSIPVYPFFTLCIAYVLLDSITKVPLMYLQVSEKANVFFWASLSRSIILLSAMYYMIVHMQHGVVGQMAGRIIVAFCFLVILVGTCRQIIKFEFDWSLFKKGLNYSWPFIPTLVIAWILNLSDRIFIEHFASLEELGLYSMAYKVAAIYVLFAAPIQQAYSPKFFTNVDNQADVFSKYPISKIKTWIVYMFVIAAFSMSLITTDMVHLFLSKQYYGISPLINILVLSYLLTTIMGVTSNLYYQYHKKIKLQMLITSFPAFLNILLNFLMVPAYGAYGAAVATLLSMFALFVVHFGYIAFAHEMPIKEFRFALLILLLAGCAYFINGYSNGFSWETLVLKLFVILAILALSFVGRQQIFRIFGKAYE